MINDLRDGEREEALRDVVELRAPLRQAVDRLVSFGWDSDSELVVFEPKDAVNVLQSYLSGGLDVAGVQLWAETLEGRDDLGFQAENGNILKEFLFQLSSPEICGPISNEMACRWRDSLREFI
ncbi:hypothetical protein [Amycolatopsis regifaucium]|uniref:hypothetical protein n=1 Tax=Amycolatopsis regifaucium TaxID=546365 RepID=UPI0011606320|nr:hypothetical protein [Amycolatopsis regifaucium]